MEHLMEGPVGMEAGLKSFAGVLIALGALLIGGCSSSPSSGGLEQVGTVASDLDEDKLTGDTTPCVNDGDCAALAGADGCRVARCLPSGECVALPEPDGTPCDEGNVCVSGGACLAGLCTGGVNQCDCEETADCERFQDADLCEARLVCLGGGCQQDLSTAVVCDEDTEGQCFVSACDPGTGACVPTELPDGSACDDGDACTTDSICESGVCSVGSTVACPDAEPCSVATCDPQEGCVTQPEEDGVSCNDGNPCTEGDVCQGGTCAGTGACECAGDEDCAPFETDPCGSPLICSEGSCVVGEGTPCAASDNPCEQSLCDVDTKSCKTVPLEDGAPCALEGACGEGATCSAGVCQESSKLCDDENPCTSDSCDPIKGCANLPLDGDCDDGDPCTSGDACVEGACVSGPSSCECESDDDCQGPDYDPCLGTWACQDSSCSPLEGTAVVCEDVDGAGPCALGVCDSETGGCVLSVVDDGVACDTGDPCLVGAACEGGTCSGAEPKCEDDNPCTQDVCASDGDCSYVNLDVPCDDGNACTIGDSCLNGSCFADAVLNCDSDEACVETSCDKASGCVSAPAADNTPCDDSNACTDADTCVGGACVGESVCQCTTDADCEDDGNACNGTFICQENLCVVAEGTVVVCPEMGPCLSTKCNPDSGECDPVNADNGTVCEIDDPCLSNTTCDDGVCVGQDVVCDDQDPCTIDSCEALEGGCVYLPASDVPCDDGDPCTAADGDVCVEGKCTGGPVFGCEDGNACTDNICVTGEGCDNPELDCDDDNPCTIDSCDPDTGCQKIPKCDELDPLSCKVAVCDGSTGECLVEAAEDGAPCKPDSLCSDEGVCEAGTCIAAAAEPGKCDDGNACTEDSCDDALGCKNAPVSCDDEDPCTLDECDTKTGCVFPAKCGSTLDLKACEVETCDAGECVAAAAADDTPCDPLGVCFGTGVCASGLCLGDGNPVDCDDGNPCTTDSCVPLEGCVSNPLLVGGGECDDGNPCTENDACDGADCEGTIKSCDDADPCTTDSCGEDGDCVNAQIPGCEPKVLCDEPLGTPCNDGLDLTSGDFCMNGVCRGFHMVALGGGGGNNANPATWVDLGINHVDHSHGTWFLTFESSNYESGQIVGMSTGVKEVNGEGAEDFTYDLEFFPEVFDVDGADVPYFEEIHNGYALGADGQVWEFVPEPNGPGSWSTDTPVTAAATWDGWSYSTTLWANAASGSGTAGSLWLAGLTEDDTGASRRCFWDASGDLECQEQALAGSMTDSLPLALAGRVTAAGVELIMGADFTYSEQQIANHTLDNGTGAQPVWDEGLFDVGPEPRRTTDAAFLANGNALVVGSSGYIRYRHNGVWQWALGSSGFNYGEDMEGVWAGSGTAVIASTTDNTFRVWVAPQDKLLNQVASWKQISIPRVYKAAGQADLPLYGGRLTDVTGDDEGNIRLVGESYWNYSGNNYRKLAIIYTRKP